MNFMKLLKDIPAPWDIAKDTAQAPFQQRTDQPWLQGTARNVGHAAFGDEIGNRVDQKMLGDYEGGFRDPNNMPATHGPASVPPPLTKQQAQPTNPWDAFIQQFLRAQQ